MRRVLVCLLIAVPLGAAADSHKHRARTDDEKARAALAVIDGTAWVDDSPVPPPSKPASPQLAPPASPRAPRDDGRVREDRDDARRIASRLQPWRASILDGSSHASPTLTDAEKLEAGDGYYLRRPQRAYGAPAVVEYVRQAVAEVRAAYPDVHDLAIGDLSAEHGGALAGHVSHRTGHDVDVGFYFRHAPHGFEDAGADLDLAATWALVTAFARTADTSDGVQIMFLDYGVQKRLYEWARAHGTDEDELARVLQYPAGRDATSGLVRHWPNHANHLHVRFKNAASR
ncbi:MAG: penicillin-insensitive murein endopeptidase [Deltaproteobacteria bacterium]|nr:penicillin-insensitive murein endopeptidase [Deltaproteobacteria bacterium]